MFQRLGLRIAEYGQAADVSITVERPLPTFDWTYTLTLQPTGLTLAMGTIEAVDEFDAGPKPATHRPFGGAAIVWHDVCRISHH